MAPISSVALRVRTRWSFDRSSEGDYEANDTSHRSQTLRPKNLARRDHGDGHGQNDTAVDES